MAALPLLLEASFFAYQEFRCLVKPRFVYFPWQISHSEDEYENEELHDIPLINYEINNTFNSDSDSVQSTYEQVEGSRKRKKSTKCIKSLTANFSLK